MQNIDKAIYEAQKIMKGRKYYRVNDTSIIHQNFPSGVTNELDYYQTLSAMKSKFPYSLMWGSMIHIGGLAYTQHPTQ